MGGTGSVPMLSLDAGLTHYLTEIRSFSILRPDQESAFAKRWREQGDREPPTVLSPAIFGSSLKSPCDIGATGY